MRCAFEEQSCAHWTSLVATMCRAARGQFSSDAARRRTARPVCEQPAPSSRCDGGLRSSHPCLPRDEPCSTRQRPRLAERGLASRQVLSPQDVVRPHLQLEVESKLNLRSPPQTPSQQQGQQGRLEPLQWPFDQIDLETAVEAAVARCLPLVVAEAQRVIFDEATHLQSTIVKEKTDHDIWKWERTQHVVRALERISNSGELCATAGWEPSVTHTVARQLARRAARKALNKAFRDVRGSKRGKRRDRRTEMRSHSGDCLVSEDAPVIVEEEVSNVLFLNATGRCELQDQKEAHLPEDVLSEAEQTGVLFLARVHSHEDLSRLRDDPLSVCVCTAGADARQADPDHEVDDDGVMFMGEGFDAEIHLSALTSCTDREEHVPFSKVELPTILKNGLVGGAQPLRTLDVEEHEFVQEEMPGMTSLGLDGLFDGAVMDIRSWMRGDTFEPELDGRDGGNLLHGAFVDGVSMEISEV